MCHGESAGDVGTSNIRHPSIKQAKEMPRFMCELSNETLIVLAEDGDHDACLERLTREMMAVDDVEWIVARQKMAEIRESNRQIVWMATIPHQVGLATAFITGFGALPFVFYKPWVVWFNDKFVTLEVPPKDELATCLEVGGWSWNWMEPVLGTASFTLLAMQLMRNIMQNLDLKPYTEGMREHRARLLARKYPQYNADIVKDFARSASMNPYAKPLRKAQATALLHKHKQ